MKLPDLPRKNNRMEAKLDGKVAAWFEENYPKSVIIEVKMKGGVVAEHQQRLINEVAETGEFTYKFPDGGKRTPLDYIVLKNIDVALCSVDKDGGSCLINNERTINIKI